MQTEDIWCYILVLFSRSQFATLIMYRTGDSLSAYAALSCYNRQLGKTFRVLLLLSYKLIYLLWTNRNRYSIYIKGHSTIFSKSLYYIRWKPDFIQTEPLFTSNGSSVYMKQRLYFLPIEPLFLQRQQSLHFVCTNKYKTPLFWNQLYFRIINRETLG